MKGSLWLWASLAVAATTGLFVYRILNPWSSYLRSQETTIVAEMGDLYSPWIGTRELILHGRNPYSSEVSHEIQMAFYGHPVDQTSAQMGRVINEQRFAYPVYAVFLMAPTVRANFYWLRRCAVICFGLLTGLTVLLCLDLLNWNPPLPVRLAICIFVLSSPPIVQGLRLQQLGLVVGFLIALGAWCVQKNRFVVAGALLAIATIKPQMSVFPVCFFLLWVSGDWRRRWRLLAAFLLTLGILVGASELLLRGWIGYFLSAVAAYSKYSPSYKSLPRIVFGDTGGALLGAVILFGVLPVGWHNRKEIAGSARFVVVFSAFLLATTLVFPLLTPFNQILLILPTVLLLRDWSSLKTFSRFVFVVITVWPWATSAVLLFFPAIVHSVSRLPLLPSLFTVLYPVFLSLLLMTRHPPDASPIDPAKTSPA